MRLGGLLLSAGGLDTLLRSLHLEVLFSGAAVSLLLSFSFLLSNGCSACLLAAEGPLDAPFLLPPPGDPEDVEAVEVPLAPPGDTKMGNSNFSKSI